MRSSKQKQIGFDFLTKNCKHFGGAYLKKSNAKVARPISTKKPMHLVLRSSMAKGAMSFLRREREVQLRINAQAKKFGVKIYRFANGGNHLHMVILPGSRQNFNGFIRAITGLLARLQLGAERGRALGKKFWDQRPFTRIIEWGREFRLVSQYLMRNTLEAWGFIAYKSRIPRSAFLRSRFSTA